jgi:eukaryotic translation initiation factor 2C
MYEASILPAAGSTSRRMKRRVWHLAEETPAWAQHGLKGKVAHDHAEKLVSVITLYVPYLGAPYNAYGMSMCSRSCYCSPQPLVIEVPFYEEDETGPPATGGKTYTLTIKHSQDIDMSTLVKYLAHDPQVGTFHKQAITN